MEFAPYGTATITIVGHAPSDHCLQKKEATTGYFLLPHCSQRIWEDADLLKYEVKTVFTPSAEYKLKPPSLGTVEKEYNLPKKEADKVPEAHDMEVAKFELVSDENAEYGVEPEREPTDATIRIVFQTPTIELTLYSPGTFAAKGELIKRPDEEADDSLTVDGEDLEHGYVGIMQVNADNDDEDEIPEPPADPPRDNDDDTPKEQDDDLVAIKLEVKKPEDFKFEDEMLKFKIPEHVRIFGSDKQEISKGILENGKELGAGADGGLGDAIANEEVVLYAEGMGELGQQGAFDGGEISLEILDGDRRELLTQCYLFPMEIVPDWNRDGMITNADSGKASEQKPFVFWINKDDDEHVNPEMGDIPQDNGDGDDMAVNGLRDLIDFFPVQLRIKRMLEIFPIDGYTYKISHPDGAFHFIEMPDIIPDSQRSEGAGSYLANESAALDVMFQIMKSTEGEGTALTPDFLNAAKEGKGILLFEAKETTEQPFQLIVSKKSNDSKMARSRSEEWMNMVPVKDMFWSGSVRGAVTANPNTAAIQVPEHDGFRETHKDLWFVFCHGYNVSTNGARGWNAEIFKRLHQMGSDAKFIGVTWEGNEGQINESIPFIGGTTADYWTNVNNAFKSSEALAVLVNGLKGEDGETNVKKVIGAHSLGNILVSSAICDHGLDAEQYFLIDAAAPREAYSASHILTDIEDLRNPSWANVEQRLWSTFYWNLFPEADPKKDTDKRRNLTWNSRFYNLNDMTTPHNYYSSGEEVLEAGDGTKPQLFVEVISQKRLAWVKSEMGKGEFAKKVVAGVRQSNGGWAFNGHWNGNPPTTNQPLIAQPYFKPFTEFGNQSIHGPNGSVLAEQAHLRNFLLAHDLPALSQPAGSTPISKLWIGDDGNTNMMNLRGINWGNWKHNDLKDKHLDYVWRLYSDIVRRGDLNRDFRPPPIK